MGECAYPCPMCLALPCSPVPPGATPVWHPCAVHSLRRSLLHPEIFIFVFVTFQNLSNLPLTCSRLIRTGSIAQQPHPRPTKSPWSIRASVCTPLLPGTNGDRIMPLRRALALPRHRIVRLSPLQLDVSVYVSTRAFHERCGVVLTLSLSQRPPCPQ
jgi:hypothetical protein